MADIWLPGWPVRILGNAVRGKPYQFTHNPKVCLHTTEGSSVAGAIAAYTPYPPHLVYDWRNRERAQHVPLNLAAYSAMDGNDDDYMIQVELVGFAAQTRDWPEQALRNIAEDIVRPLETHFRVPRRVIGVGFKDSRDGLRPYISTAESPIRLSWTGLRDFSGWLGHQHLPAPDTHWDPGALPMHKILSYLEDELSAQDVQAGTSASLQWKYDTPEGKRDLVQELQDTRRAVADTAGQTKGVNQRLDKVNENLGKLVAVFTEVSTKLDRLSTGGVDTAQLAEQLSAIQDRKARDGDPGTGPVS
ncbi:hypothetical protein JOF41_007387 [Saccharothrix coeruleofusca]|uniref:hypothetical protein n=1 Tax=Saccharothrix coeruleofusca TaxID=33919 RepID=UPI001AE604D8|nr:hypothetical protein [Saccharothrix coeruleofusca]MBP2341133.1 hypothetical protein [Saccharothrix coeruleofusca]